MNSVSAETFSQVLIWLAVLVGMIVIAVVLVRRFRGQSAEDQQADAALLTKFQEMKHEGDISDAEYRTIKSVLGAKLQREVKGSNSKG